MVEDVKGLDTKLERFRFGKAQVFEQRDIEVLHSGTMEITP